MATLAFIVADGVIYASWLLIVAVGIRWCTASCAS